MMNVQQQLNLKATLFDLMEEKKASDARIAELEQQVKDKERLVDDVTGRLNTATNIADNRAERLRDVLIGKRDIARENMQMKDDMERLERKNKLLTDEVRVAKAQKTRQLSMNELTQIQQNLHEKVVKNMIHQLNSSISPTIYAPTPSPMDAF